MGARVAAIGDHDLSLDEVLCLPMRLAPIATKVGSRRATGDLAIEPVAAPPPPLREAGFWIVDDVTDNANVLVGRRSFTVHHRDRFSGFLAALQVRAEIRRVSRMIAEAVGCRRLVFCSDLGGSSDWDWVDRGDRVDDVLTSLTRDWGQRPARWDEEFDDGELMTRGFKWPFFVDEWA